MTVGNQQPSIAIHGGAGNLARYRGTGRIEEASAFLGTLIDEMHRELAQGAAAVDVAAEVVVRMEDVGFFHAGKGSAASSSGDVELDASIMEGSEGQAGAVALVRNVKNPILLARVVLEKTQHVMMAGPSAEELADAHGIERVGADYFTPCDVINGVVVESDTSSTGTVGAVVRDSHGLFAAATSTGGVLRKQSGRIGDTPVIGAGTFAKNAVGAVSSTGVGEYFMRQVAAYQVIARMELLGESVGTATGMVMQHIDDDNGSGGLIAVGPRGEIAMPFNTTGMYRASIDAWGKRTVGVL